MAGTGDRGLHELREKRHAHAGFHFVGVLAGLGENGWILIRANFEPVAHTNEHLRFVEQLARQGFQFIPPMPVEQHHLANSLVTQGIDQIAKQFQQRGRRHAQGQRPGNLQMIRIHAKRHARQQQDRRPLFVRPFTRSPADRFSFVIIRAIRHVIIVRLRRPERQHHHFPFLAADESMILFR